MYSSWIFADNYGIRIGLLSKSFTKTDMIFVNPLLGMMPDGETYRIFQYPVGFFFVKLIY